MLGMGQLFPRITYLYCLYGFYNPEGNVNKGNYDELLGDHVLWRKSQFFIREALCENEEGQLHPCSNRYVDAYEIK